MHYTICGAHSPGVERHGLEERLTRPAHDDVVPAVVLDRDALDARDKLVHPAQLPDGAHRREDVVRHIRAVGRVLNEGRERHRDSFMLNAWHTVGCDFLDGLGFSGRRRRRVGAAAKRAHVAGHATMRKGAASECAGGGCGYWQLHK